MCWYEYKLCYRRLEQSCGRPILNSLETTIFGGNVEFVSMYIRKSVDTSVLSWTINMSESTCFSIKFIMIAWCCQLKNRTKWIICELQISLLAAILYLSAILNDRCIYICLYS